MGNACCTDEERLAGKGPKAHEIDGNTLKIRAFASGKDGVSMIESYVPSPADPKEFGTSRFKLDEGFFKLDDRIKALIQSFGLYTFNAEDNEVKRFAKNEIFRIVRSEYVFEGQCSANKRQGKGYMLTKEGDLWICTFENDLPQGKGVVYFQSGDYFEGQMDRGSTVKGTMTYAEGSKYVGDFMTLGYRHGQGTFIDESGSSYEGSWKNNLKDGPGLFIQQEVWRDGQRVDRLMQNGKNPAFMPTAVADGSSQPQKDKMSIF